MRRISVDTVIVGSKRVKKGFGDTYILLREYCMQ
jgi:hypothetical protein